MERNDIRFFRSNSLDIVLVSLKIFLSFTTILLKSSFSRSRRMLFVFALLHLRFLQEQRHLLDLSEWFSRFLLRHRRSSCSSAVFFPSAAVRTITPKFFGLIASMIFCSRFLSSEECIFLETATISLKGVSTTKLPGRDIHNLVVGLLQQWFF